jgi:hypothetical protein
MTSPPDQPKPPNSTTDTYAAKPGDSEKLEIGNNDLTLPMRDKTGTFAMTPSVDSFERKLVGLAGTAAKSSEDPSGAANDPAIFAKLTQSPITTATTAMPPPEAPMASDLYGQGTASQRGCKQISNVLVSRPAPRRSPRAVAKPAITARKSRLRTNRDRRAVSWITFSLRARDHAALQRRHLGVASCHAAYPLARRGVAQDLRDRSR